MPTNPFAWARQPLRGLNINATKCSILHIAYATIEMRRITDRLDLGLTMLQFIANLAHSRKSGKNHAFGSDIAWLLRSSSASFET